jgi:hypothetical protein
MRRLAPFLSLALLILGALAAPLHAQTKRGKYDPAGFWNFGPGGGGPPSVTWTLVQHPSNVTCSGTDCTITGLTITAGDLLIAAGTYFANGGAVFSSVTGGGVWTHCPASAALINYTGIDFVSSDCAYILSAGGGAGITVDWAWSTGVPFSALEFYEVKRSTGTATYDTGGTITYANCGSCTGPSLTISGASDYIAQWGSFDNTVTPPGTAPWLTPNDSDNSNTDSVWLGAINQTTGASPPTSTQVTAGSSGAAMSGVAFQ